MLTLYPGLMANMDDGHLIRSLECEPSIMRTPVELAERPEPDAIDARISEAVAQYPEEDFLEALADRVFELGEKLRGDNKAEAHAIAKELTELGQTVANAAAYGREELDQILNPKKEPTPCA